MPRAVFDTAIRSLSRIHRGKVRDVFAIDDDHLLMVATDRVSAFDLVMPNPAPGKGVLLTEVALFWFGHFADTRNHLATLTLDEVLPDPDERAEATGRTMVVKRLDGLPIEAVVRGYLIGSGWKDYQATGSVCGIPLRAGLEQAGRLDEPLFTPATKAAVGDHDENISFTETANRIGRERAEQVRDLSLELYGRAAAHAEARGIIIADTKFEFGLDADENLVLMDEVLTPDSSRFWPADRYRPGCSPPSFDKQFLRDWLETLDWDKTAPGPALPAAVIEGTLAGYREARDRLVGPARV
ncbi:MAG: phosphoribosylaminoimidazolesuccinocarboxamide synthase [Pseudomonadota bacterium]